MVLRKFASITNTGKKQTNKAVLQLWGFCTYIANFFHLQKSLRVQKYLFLEKHKSLSQDRMTQAGCDSCQHHAPLAVQEPRLLPSPSCRRLPKNSPLPAFPLHEPSGGRGTLQSTQGTHWKFTGQPTRFKCKLSSGCWNPSLPQYTHYNLALLVHILPRDLISAPQYRYS